MDDFSPVKEGDGTPTARNDGKSVWEMARTCSTPHWSNPFDPGEVVDAGNGSRLEQLIPEQEFCRPGAGWPSGASVPEAELPLTIKASSKTGFISESERDVTR